MPSINHSCIKVKKNGYSSSKSSMKSINSMKVLNMSALAYAAKKMGKFLLLPGGQPGYKLFWYTSKYVLRGLFSVCVS